MSTQWRTVEVFLPAGLAPDAVRAALRFEVLKTASDTGEFAERIRLEAGASHAEGWRKWRASYLPGRPRVIAG